MGNSSFSVFVSPYLLASLVVTTKSPQVENRQPLGLVEVLLFWWSLVFLLLRLRSEDMAGYIKSLCRSQNTPNFKILCVLLQNIILSKQPSIAGRWSDCCIGSTVWFFSGVLWLSTRFTGQVDVFWTSVSSVVAVAVFFIVVVVVFFEVRHCGSTVVFSVLIIFCPLFLSFVSTDGTDFYTVPFIYSGGTMVRVFQQLL